MGGDYGFSVVVFEQRLRCRWNHLVLWCGGPFGASGLGDVRSEHRLRIGYVVQLEGASTWGFLTT